MAQMVEVDRNRFRLVDHVDSLWGHIMKCA
jgi:hypothetical protein